MRRKEDRTKIVRIVKGPRDVTVRPGGVAQENPEAGRNPAPGSFVLRPRYLRGTSSVVRHRRPPAMRNALLTFGIAAFCAGCAASGAPLDAATFSNTVWREVCPGEANDTLYLRFLPDGSFAWSADGLDPGDFHHDGNDRWAVVERTLVVSWEEDLERTTYIMRDDPEVLLGNSTRACGREARLERAH